MKNTVIKFGAYGFLLGLGLFLAGVFFGENLEMSQGMVIGYLTILASLIFVFFGIKHYRDKQNNGVLTIGKAIVIGISISIFAAIGIAIADYIYTSAINPNFYEDYVAAQRAEGYTGEIPDYGNFGLALFMFGQVMIIGFIISLISAVVLQRKNN